MSNKIYTKTGDDGTSGLVGGTRVKKSNLRLEAYGTVDELNSWVGVVRALVSDPGVTDMLLRIQNNLFIAGSKLASDEKGIALTGSLGIKEEETGILEKEMDDYEKGLRPLHHFILPGGSILAGYCHIARTVCRRAERRIVQLDELSGVDHTIVKYINRLSDYFFMLSRKVAADTGAGEIPWTRL